jgi:hypothetical protein
LLLLLLLQWRVAATAAVAAVAGCQVDDGLQQARCLW